MGRDAGERGRVPTERREGHRADKSPISCASQQGLLSWVACVWAEAGREKKGSVEAPVGSSTCLLLPPDSGQVSLEGMG